MKLRHFVVDAFTNERFRGNAAAVCVLDGRLDDDTLSSIARENNLAETAFLVRHGAEWNIRWLTPEVEVDLCGHATLASAHVVLTQLEPSASTVTFQSQSGPLIVKRDPASPNSYAMDFPARRTEPVDVDAAIERALGHKVLAMHRFQGDVVCVLESAAVVEALRPDFASLRKHEARAVSVTAAGAPGGEEHGDVDFVSRFFAPNEGIDENPVTGSAHCMLGPLWSTKLGKNSLRARQLSARRGDVGVEVKGDRVVLRGQAVLVVEGVMHV